MENIVKTKKSVRCDCCENLATTEHYVMEAGGILDVCENCDCMLTMQDEKSLLEIELKKNLISYGEDDY